MEHFNVLLAVVVRAVTIFSLEDILTVKMLVDNKEKPYQRYNNSFFLFRCLFLTLTIIWSVNIEIDNNHNLIQQVTLEASAKPWLTEQLFTQITFLQYKPTYIFRCAFCKNSSITLRRASKQSSNKWGYVMAETRR